MSCPRTRWGCAGSNATSNQGGAPVVPKPPALLCVPHSIQDDRTAGPLAAPASDLAPGRFSMGASPVASGKHALSDGIAGAVTAVARTEGV